MFKLSNYFSKQEEAMAPEAPQGSAAEAPVTPEEQSPTQEPEQAQTPEPEPEPITPEETVPASGEGYEDTFYGHAAEMFDNAQLNGQPVVDYFEEHGEFHADHVKQMEEKMGKAQASILLQGIQAEVSKATASQEEADKVIYEAVGGQENFDAAATWIQSEDSGWTDEERADMNKLLDMGGNISQWAAQLMMIDFSNAGNPAVAPVPTKPAIRDGHKAQPSTPELITIQDYNQGIKAAKTQSEVDALVKRANFTRSSKDAFDLGWKFG